MFIILLFYYSIRWLTADVLQHRAVTDGSVPSQPQWARRLDTSTLKLNPAVNNVVNDAFAFWHLSHSSVPTDLAAHQQVLQRCRLNSVKVWSGCCRWAEAPAERQTTGAKHTQGWTTVITKQEQHFLYLCYLLGVGQKIDSLIYRDTLFLIFWIDFSIKNRFY